MQQPSFTSPSESQFIGRNINDFQLKDVPYLNAHPEVFHKVASPSYGSIVLSDKFIVGIFNMLSRSVSPAIAYMLKVQISPTEYYFPTIVVGKSPDGSYIYDTLCANHYMLNESLTTSTGNALSWAHPANLSVEVQSYIEKQAKKSMTQLIPAFTDGLSPSTCDHRTRQLGTEPGMCEHVALLLLKLTQAFGVRAIPEVMPVLTRQLEDVLTMGATDENGEVDTRSPLEIALSKYAFRYPILVEGSQGAGKTQGARDYAYNSKCTVVSLAGHEGMTTDEMCGYNFVENGNSIWIDGPLSEACRLASKGAKVILVADEILRIPARQLSIFLTLLSPFEGHLYLNTGRIINVSEDRIAKMEVLKIPADNLAIVATTNIGPNFNVDDMDPAFRERFYIVRQDSSPDFVKFVCSKLLKDSPLDEDTLIPKLMSFYQSMLRAKQASKVNDTPSVRIFANAIKLHSTEEEVAAYLKSSYLQWVVHDMDGYPNQDQMLMVHEAVDSAFNGS